MKSPVRLTARGFGSALATGVFVCTLGALAVPASARQNQHAPIDVPAGDIKIHGHWVIDVRNPDGTSAARREFDNALTESGKAHITQVLLRAFTPGPWAIQLGSGLASGPCEEASLSLYREDACYAVPQSMAGAAFLPQTAFPTLTTSLGGPGNSQLILAGHITVRTAGQIDTVRTLQGPCSGQVPPASCHEFNGSTAIVTHHNLLDSQGNWTPILVVPGQIVQVTVTLSFCGSEGCQS